MNEDVVVIIPSNRPELAKQCQESMLPYKSVIFDGTGYPSYAKIMNDVIMSCPTELVLVCNDKGRPKPEHIEKVIRLLNEGYGMVWLHPCGFGGFYKDVIRKIGFYDERYSDGNYEDCDIQRRIYEADIAWYDRFEVDWIYVPSSWRAQLSVEHFRKKWNNFERLIPEENYEYDLGPYQGRTFMPFKKSKTYPGVPQEFLEEGAYLCDACTNGRVSHYCIFCQPKFLKFTKGENIS